MIRRNPDGDLPAIHSDAFATLPPSFAANIIGGQIVMAEEEAIRVPSGKPVDFLSRTQPAEPDGV